MKMLLMLIGLGMSNAPLDERRELSFYHTHTGKTLAVTYFHDGAYDSTALENIDDYLKDFHNGARHRIDPALLDVLHDIKVKTRTRAPFEVISAYRSPQTNQWLLDTTTGVAEGSMHLQGQAIDIRLRDVELEELRIVALQLKRGGVGFYPDSQFVHVDTGRVRFWQSRISGQSVFRPPRQMAPDTVWRLQFEALMQGRQFHPGVLEQRRKPLHGVLLAVHYKGTLRRRLRVPAQQLVAIRMR